MSGSDIQVNTSDGGTIDFEQDVFGTLEGYAENLTRLLLPDNITGGGRVLNVDGGWGTGKTFFIERWANKLRDDGYAVVKFNAWENDSAEDPLGPLLASIHEQLKGHIDESTFDEIKAAAGKLVWSAVKVGVNVVVDRTVGQKSKDDVLNHIQAFRSGISDVAASKYIDDQIDKLRLQKALRESLQELAEKIAAKKVKSQEIETQEHSEIPVWIFIDELDRCRPSFAVELLERVKHCFNLNGFRFVFATNASQLVHSIKVLYGQEFDAIIYLQRFFEYTFVLPLQAGDVFTQKLLQDCNLLSEYETSGKYELLGWVEFDDFESHPFVAFSQWLQLPLRQQEQAFKYLRLCLGQLTLRSDKSLKIHIVLLSYLACAFMHSQDLYMFSSNVWGYFKESQCFMALPKNVRDMLCLYFDIFYMSDRELLEHKSKILKQYQHSDSREVDARWTRIRILFEQREWVKRHLDVFMFAGEILAVSAGAK